MPRSTSILALVFALGWSGDRPTLGQAPAIQGSVDRYLSGSKRVTIEWAAPAAFGKYPAVILLHGSGGLGDATGDVFREIATSLAQRGYVGFVPHLFERTNHRVGAGFAQGEYEAMIEAVKDAVAFASARPEVDAGRIGFIGYSMGSNLAKVQAIRDPHVKALVLVSGAYPPVQPNKKLPAQLMLHGSKDRSTPLDYLKKYQDALKEQGMPLRHPRLRRPRA